MKINQKLIIVAKLITLIFLVLVDAYYFVIAVGTSPHINSEMVNFDLLLHFPLLLLYLSIYSVRVFVRLDKLIYLILLIVDTYLLSEIVLKYPLLCLFLFVENVNCYTVILNKMDVENAFELNPSKFVTFMKKIQFRIKEIPF